MLMLVVMLYRLVDALAVTQIEWLSPDTILTVDQFIGQLPGDTILRASGELSRETDHPAFRGQFSLDSERLDGLAYLWRKPDDNSVLFNQAGALSGNVMLTGDALRVSEAELTLNGVAHAVDVRVGFGGEKRLDVVGHFAGLGDTGSAVLGALLPQVAADTNFGISFPEGSFSLTGQEARVLGYDGADMVAEGQWAGDGISFSRLSAKNWGGLGFDATLEGRGSLAAPELSGSGRLTVASAGAPALAGLYDLLGTPESWRRFIARSAPRSRQAWHFSALPAVVNTRAPKALASWIAVVPMPLEPPTTRTVRPEKSRGSEIIGSSQKVARRVSRTSLRRAYRPAGRLVHVPGARRRGPVREAPKQRRGPSPAPVVQVRSRGALRRRR